MQYAAVRAARRDYYSARPDSTVVARLLCVTQLNSNILPRYNLAGRLANTTRLLVVTVGIPRTVNGGAVEGDGARVAGVGGVQVDGATSASGPCQAAAYDRQPIAHRRHVACAPVGQGTVEGAVWASAGDAGGAGPAACRRAEAKEQKRGEHVEGRFGHDLRLTIALRPHTELELGLGLVLAQTFLRTQNI